MIIIIICCICKTATTKTYRCVGFMSFLTSIIPGVKGENLIVIGTVITMSVVHILILSVFLIMIYRLILTLKRRRSCHSYRATIAPELSSYHFDLLIPYPSSPVTVKVMNLKYPIHFYYRPITENYMIQVKI